MSTGNNSKSESGGVLIMGMHRSGTSCLAGMLRQCGLFLGDANRFTCFNPKGNQESREVQYINERLLNVQDASWYNPAEVKSIPALLSIRILRYRKLLAKKSHWGIKDPRLLFCIDAWRHPQDKLIGTFRHPASVKESLDLRNKMRRKPISDDNWEKLWYRYNRRMVDMYCRSSFPVVNFDWDEQRYLRMIDRLAVWLDLPGNHPDFFDSSLIHYRNTSSREIKNPGYRALYQQLTVISQEEEKKLAF